MAKMAEVETSRLLKKWVLAGAEAASGNGSSARLASGAVGRVLPRSRMRRSVPGARVSASAAPRDRALAP